MSATSGLGDLAALLRIKQVRERRAAAALASAAQDERRAADAAARSTDAAASHAAGRVTMEAAIYAGLLVGPVAVRRFQGEAGRLAGLAAQAGVLAQRSEAAAQARVAATGVAQAARIAQAAALRDVEAAGLLRKELSRQAVEREEQREEAEIEETAGRPRHAG